MSQKEFEVIKKVYNQNIITFTTVLLLGKVLIFGGGGFFLCAIAGVIMGVFYCRIKLMLSAFLKTLSDNDNKILIIIMSVASFVLIKQQPAIISFIVLLALSAPYFRARANKE